MGRSRRLVVDNGNSWSFRAYYYADSRPTDNGSVSHDSGDYVVFSPSAADNPDQVYGLSQGLFHDRTNAFQSFVVWAKGVISFGLPTSEQIAFMNAADANTDLSLFPGQFIEAGYVDPQFSDLYVGIRNPTTAAPFAAYTMVQFGTRTITIFDDHINVSDGSVVIDLGTGIRQSTDDEVGGTFRLPEFITVNGTSGNDALNGTAAPQTINGLEGNDTIIAGDGATDIFGGDGDDTLTGGKSRDRIYGGIGNDTIRGSYGDLMYGESGNDTFYAQNGGTVIGASGVDRLVLDLSQRSDPLDLTLRDGPDGFIKSIRTSYTGIELLDVVGGSGNDKLTGNAAANKIDGGEGADTIDGGAGDDVLDSGVGGIALEGPVTASSEDQFAPVPIDNAFSNNPGGSPTATIQLEHSIYFEHYYYYSVEVAEGGSLSVDPGVDIYDSNGNYLGISAENLPQGTYSLTIYIYGPEPPFTQGGDIRATDTFSVRLSTATVPLRINTLTGGLGNDTFLVHQASDVVVEKPGEGTDTIIADLTWTLPANVEALTLKSGAGAINGTGNTLNNTITGNDSANVLAGGSGDDKLIGGGGNDTLRGDGGADRMEGGTGNDFYRVDNAGDTVIERADEGADKVLSSVRFILPDNVEALTLDGTADLYGGGNALANTLVGNSGANVLDGKAGADAMLGGAGDDTYVVDDLKDGVYETTTFSSTIDAGGIDKVVSSVNYSLAAGSRIYVENLSFLGTADLVGYGNGLANRISGNAGANKLYGLEGNDTLFGVDGNDSLSGGAGDDSLDGGTGNDRLDPGSGKDSLKGGAGADVFVFTAEAFADAGSKVTADTILDFRHSDGDRIDLRQIDAIPSLTGDQAFTFIGTGAFTKYAGELRVENAANATWLVADRNGDGIGDGFIKLAAGVSLVAADLML